MGRHNQQHAYTRISEGGKFERDNVGEVVVMTVTVQWGWLVRGPGNQRELET